mgnify:CR=1 FL=1
MAKIRLTRAMKDYITEELMSPITGWYNEENEKIKQVQEEDLKSLYTISDEYANKLAEFMEALGYEVQNMENIRSRLMHEVRYICNSRFVKIREDKSSLKLKEKFVEKNKEVKRALTQIELECALGTDKEEFMSLLNSYKETLVQDL